MNATEIVLGAVLLYSIGTLIWLRWQREIKPPED